MTLLCLVEFGLDLYFCFFPFLFLHTLPDDDDYYDVEGDGLFVIRSEIDLCDL
jgi:hypothetical protein